MTTFDNPSLIYEYQSYLLGNQLAFPLAKQGSKTEEDKNAKIVLRYAVENLLKWNPIEMRDHFTLEVIERLKLQRVVAGIVVPPEIDKKEDLDYFAHILYPAAVPYNFKKLTIKAYKRVLNNTTRKYPKGFFDDPRGRDRALYCLQYILSKCTLAETYEQLYARFADKSANNLLEATRLISARRRHWDSALDYFHAVMPDEPMFNVLYHFYKVWHMFPAKSPLRPPIAKMLTIDPKNMES